MGNSKKIRQGNAIVVKIPEVLASAGNKKFYLHRSDGEVLLVPKIRDYFEEAIDGEYRQPLEWEDEYFPSGREKIE